jgi:hypothetical protein
VKQKFFLIKKEFLFSWLLFYFLFMVAYNVLYVKPIVRYHRVSNTLTTKTKGLGDNGDVELTINHTKPFV